MGEPGRRGHRRVQVPGAAGADPTPRRGPDAADPLRASGDTDAAWGDRADSTSNDARLREDVPPHWGRR